MDRQISLIGKASHRDGFAVLTFKTSGGDFSIPVTAEEAKDFPETVSTVVADKKTGLTSTLPAEYDSIFTLTITRSKKAAAPAPAPVAAPPTSTTAPAPATAPPAPVKTVA